MCEQEQLAKASTLCLNNAKQYVKDAELLFSTESFGHALALTILGDIELGKSVIYHLCSKGLIIEKVLPTQFISYLEEKKYEKLASNTWWVGLVLASNIDVLVPNLLTFVRYSGTFSIEGSKSNLSKDSKKLMSEIIEEMKPENAKIHQLLEFASKGFFVNFKIEENKLDSPLSVEKSLVRERIEKVKERIKNGEPFLLLSFSGIQKKIAQGLLEAAFESIIPIRTEINQLPLPLKTY